MPTYDYRCRKCQHLFELFHSIKDSTAKRCPRCRGKAERVPTAGAGILFKGSGFYITDYRSRDYQEKARKEKSAGDGAKPEAGGASTPSPASGARSATGDSGKVAPPAGRRAGKSEKKRPRSGAERGRRKGD